MRITQTVVFVNGRKEENLNLCSLEMNMHLVIEYTDAFYDPLREALVVEVTVSEKDLIKLKEHMGV